MNITIIMGDLLSFTLSVSVSPGLVRRALLLFSCDTRSHLLVHLECRLKFLLYLTVDTRIALINATTETRYIPQPVSRWDDFTPRGSQSMYARPPVGSKGQFRLKCHQISFRRNSFQVIACLEIFFSPVRVDRRLGKLVRSSRLDPRRPPFSRGRTVSGEFCVAGGSGFRIGMMPFETSCLLYRFPAFGSHLYRTKQQRRVPRGKISSTFLFMLIELVDCSLVHGRPSFTRRIFPLPRLFMST